jgi:hypothetical protein
MNRFFHGKWIWTVIYPLIFFISWTYVGLDGLVCYALDNKPVQTAGKHSAGPWSGFNAALGDLEKILVELQSSAAHSSNASALWKGFDEQVQKIEALDKEIKKRFEQDAAHLSHARLDEKILKRQKANVARYKQKMGRLFDLVGEIRASQDDPQASKIVMADLVKLLKERGKKRKARKTFDPNNMPFQNRRLKPKAPRMDKESFERELKTSQVKKKSVNANKHAVLDKVLDLLTPSAEAAPAPPVPADLAETMEIQFTQDILAKAAELNHDPVKIYNWVRNNVEYVPTWGSIQGAQYCLETLQGNAFDTASLLIALLRASNIPARYVMGTVEIPIDQVMNWVGGFTDAQAALDFMASGGVPVTALRDAPDGPIKYARIEHVWVEAFVDYSPSRASRHKDGQGDTWIEVDPSYKQYGYVQGLDLKTVVPFDAQNFVDQLTASATSDENEGYVTGLDSALMQTTLQNYRSNIRNYINQNMPGATVGDLLGKKKAVIEDRSFLLGTLPYKKAVKGTEFSVIPDNLRHRISFNLAVDDFDDTPLQIVRRLPEIAGKKITISYRPATANDEAIVNSYLPQPHDDGSPIQPNEWPSTLPASTIHVIPELRINGEIVATGTSVGLGSEEIFTMQFSDPSTGSSPIQNTIHAGEYFAIGLDVTRPSKKQFGRLKDDISQTMASIEQQQEPGITKEGLFGDLFYATAQVYHAEVEKSRYLAAESEGAVYATLPSETIFGMQLVVDYLWGIPQTVSQAGLLMDADHLACFVQAKDGEQGTAIKFMRMSGMASSALEHAVPEKMFSTTDNPVEAISAVKALKIANDQGIPIFYITQTNISTVLPQLQIDSQAKSEIENAIYAGKEVIVSKTNINFHEWTGCGYIIIDPVTGAGAYMISGGQNGAQLLFYYFFFLVAIIAAAVIAGPFSLMFAFVAFDSFLFLQDVGDILEKENLTIDEIDEEIEEAADMGAIEVATAFLGPLFEAGGHVTEAWHWVLEINLLIFHFTWFD